MEGFPLLGWVLAREENFLFRDSAVLAHTA